MFIEDWCAPPLPYWSNVLSLAGRTASCAFGVRRRRPTPAAQWRCGQVLVHRSNAQELREDEWDMVCAPLVGDYGDHQVCQTQNASKWNNWTGLKLSGMKNTRNSWFGGTQASAFWRSRSCSGKSTCESARGHSPSHWCRNSWTCGKESRCFQNRAASRKKSSVASDPCQSLAIYPIDTVSFSEVLHNESFGSSFSFLLRAVAPPINSTSKAMHVLIFVMFQLSLHNRVVCSLVEVTAFVRGPWPSMVEDLILERWSVTPWLSHQGFAGVALQHYMQLLI